MLKFGIEILKYYMLEEPSWIWLVGPAFLLSQSPRLAQCPDVIFKGVLQSGA